MNRRYTEVRTRYVGDVLEQLRAQTMLRSTVEPPTWLGKAPEGFNAEECFASRKQIVHLPSLVNQKDNCTTPVTPAFFATSACQFDIDCSAPKPTAWLRFLDELWGDDPESVESLQEWFGYLLTPDTRQQKLLLIVGPKRSGKGTIARVLASLLGKSNVAAPTMHSLTTNFGLASLVGKSLAIISDARLSGRSDQSIVVERILSITGEDLQTVDRKHREPVTCKLPTRFVILSNELPRLNDSSGAIVSRMVLLETRRSFLGNEDLALTDKLLDELPGILLWAIDGWKRLRERGRLVQPDSGFESLAELNDLASPVSAFLADCCVVDVVEVTPKDELFEAWKSWCEKAGRGKFVGTSASFGRDLLAANTLVRSRRIGPRGERLHVYDGVGSKPDFTK